MTNENHRSFFPALISIAIRHSRNSELTWQIPQVLVEYGIYVMVNVLMTAGIITYVLNVSDVMVVSLDSFSFYTKYTAIAIVVAVITPYIQEIVKKYVEVAFTVRKKDEILEEHRKDN